MKPKVIHFMQDGHHHIIVTKKGWFKEKTTHYSLISELAQLAWCDETNGGFASVSESMWLTKLMQETPVTEHE